MTYDAEEDCFTCGENFFGECTKLEHGQFVTTDGTAPARERLAARQKILESQRGYAEKTWELRAASQENITRTWYLARWKELAAQTGLWIPAFLTRGKANVRTELFFLFAMAFNLKN